jgi:hypothetical protein
MPLEAPVITTLCAGDVEGGAVLIVSPKAVMPPQSTRV